jgi:uncharacterized protein
VFSVRWLSTFFLQRALLFFCYQKSNHSGAQFFMPLELDERGRALENEYFHRKEKELLDKMKAKVDAEDSKSADMQCPRCDGTLYETEYEGVKIDVCNKCTGVWLDAGELAQIAAKDEEGSGWFSGFFK